MTTKIPYLRERKQKSGRVFYYFEYRQQNGRRTEKPLGSNFATAVLAWQVHMRTPTRGVPAKPSVAWLLDRYAREQLPLMPSTEKNQCRAALLRLNDFFTREQITEFDALCLGADAAQAFATLANHPHRARRDWSLLKLVLRWAFETKYLSDPPSVADSGLTLVVKKLRHTEMTGLILVQLEKAVKTQAQSVSVGGLMASSHEAVGLNRRTYEAARARAIQAAKKNARTDLVLALERFNWAVFSQKPE